MDVGLDSSRGHRAPVRVPIPGDPNGAEVLVCVPSVPTLVLHGWLPAPLLHAVISLEAEADPDAVVWVREQEEEPADRAQQLDAWVAAASVLPRIVLEPELAGAEALHVSEVSVRLKVAIWEATYDPFVRMLRAAATRLEGFVTDGAQAISLDAMAKRYGHRPSTIVGITDPLTAIDFDLAIAARGRLAEREALKAATTH